MIKVKTIAVRHVQQLPIEHYWTWDNPPKSRYGFDFNKVKVLGRFEGNILCQNKNNKTLRLINCCAYIDWATAQAGAVLSNGEYAPTPHTKYAEAARERYEKLPQIFKDYSE